MNIDQIAMRYVSMDLSQRAVQTNEKFFSNFDFLEILPSQKMKILSENKKIFKRIARREYWSNCNVIYQWICLGKLYKKMDFFFQISK